MTTCLFHKDMSYSEAQRVLLSSVKSGMSQEEIARIRADYAAVLPFITKNELSEQNVCFTSYQI